MPAGSYWWSGNAVPTMNNTHGERPICWLKQPVSPVGMKGRDDVGDKLGPVGHDEDVGRIEQSLRTKPLNIFLIHLDPIWRRLTDASKVEQNQKA